MWEWVNVLDWRFRSEHQLECKVLGMFCTPEKDLFLGPEKDQLLDSGSG